ncbi:hypothetical protein HID58_049657 [Brassica napus]|uniref:Uncharacterized protein n=1 Tax=Brassica napus TaxID=3708 RepID=A0ABQ8B5N4_BRANA|nr:hypothetical protein HID58_049657 [Brassica napus]
MSIKRSSVCKLGSFDSGKAWNVKKSGEPMGVDLILVDGKVTMLKVCFDYLFGTCRKKTILDGTRSKQSFIFADAPVLLLFEEVPESRNFIPKGGDNNPGHDIPGAGAVTIDPSQSVERGIHDNSNRPSNHVMLESLSGTVTEPSDIPISSDMSSAESAEAVCAHSAKKPHHG